MPFSWLKLINFFILNSSIFFIFMSKSWFFFWFMMEINMMSFIYIMNKNNNLIFLSISKYFIIQSLSSSLILLSIILMKFNINFLSNCILFFSIWLKLGMFPFSTWFLKVNKNLDLQSFFLMNIYQKIIPFYLMSIINNNNNLIMIFSSLTIMFSTIDMMNQTSINWIISNSSLNHFSWMFLSIINNNKIWMIYIIIYIILMIFLFNHIYMEKLYSFNSIFTLKSNSLSFSLLMFSFSGLPPFLGFFPKLLIFLSNNYFLLMLLFISMSIINSFNYLRLMIPTLLKVNLVKKFYNKKIFNSLITSMTNLLSIMFIFPVYFI